MRLKTILISISVIILSLSIGIAFAAWQEPTASPPGGNVEAPINVSSTGQTKTGNLTAGTEAQGVYAPVFYDYNDSQWQLNPSGNSYFSGNVGIGTTSPAEKLHVNGSLRLGAARSDNMDASTRGYVDAQSGGSMTFELGCGWFTTGTPPSIGSCTPANCPVGYTSSAISCYPTALNCCPNNEVQTCWVVAGIPLPAACRAGLAGHCYRVCYSQ